MRYGNPSIESALNELAKENLEEVFIIPLYPHFAMSSFETVVEKVKKVHKKNQYSFSIDFAKPFYNEERYLSVLADSIKPFIEKEYDHLLFSYHGIPERHVYKSDPTKSHCKIDDKCCEIKSKAHNYCYRHQVFETTKGIASLLNLPKGKYSNSFQSRLGRDPWLLPSTTDHLETLVSKGIKKLLVVCPAFVSDCLETIERNRNGIKE